MKYFYLSNYLLEKNYEIESIQVLTALSNVFNNNLFILNSLAHAYYLLHEYETSLEYAKKCYTIDNKNKDYYLLTARNYAKGFEDKKNTFYFIDKALEVGYKASELAEVEEFAVIKETYKNEYNELLKKYVK
jgi:hypothetical protein